jgi:GNAT superfamily N-acetyltransferase
MTISTSDFADAISVRPLQPSDSIPDLSALLHRAYTRLANQGLRYMATHQSDDVTRARIAKGECYVAIADGAICGTIVFIDAGRTKGYPWYDRADVASLGQFAVEPNLQAQGLGRRLISLVEARAAETGALEIALDTAEPATHLVDWYERLGYRFIEHAQWTHTNDRSVIMSKTLR